MEETKKMESTGSGQHDIRAIVRGAIQEFIALEQSKAEPAYKAELVEERKRRESLELRLNELIDENRRNRQLADEMERSSAIRSELQKLGVAKLDLAFRAVKDDISRTEDGRLIVRTDEGDIGYRDYLKSFVNENPELLPARISGGTGSGAGYKQPVTASTIDIDKIRPGMSAEELERARQEIARIALQTVRG